jgi:hypothetical protein
MICFFIPASEMSCFSRTTPDRSLTRSFSTPFGSASAGPGSSIGWIRFGLEAGAGVFLKFSDEMAEEFTGI